MASKLGGDIEQSPVQPFHQEDDGLGLPPKQHSNRWDQFSGHLGMAHGSEKIGDLPLHLADLDLEDGHPHSARGMHLVQPQAGRGISGTVGLGAAVESRNNAQQSQAESHPLRREADMLRAAMGGTGAMFGTATPASQGAASTPVSRSSKLLAGDVTGTTKSETLQSAASRLQKSPFQPDPMDLMSPDKTPANSRTGLSPLQGSRAWTPGAVSNSTSGSEEMEVIEVTDSESDGSSDSESNERSADGSHVSRSHTPRRWSVNNGK